MTKYIFLLCLLPITNVFSQPTITEAQFELNVGDLLAYYAQSYQPPSEGPAQIWDYTHLDVTSPTTIYVVAGTPPSQLCITGITGDCFLIDSSGMQRTEMLSPGGNIIYQDHEYVFQFPITYGDSMVDNYHSNYTVSGMPAIRTGTTTIQVVGYGTIMLPGSVTINNAMLVKNHILQTDSVDVGSWSVSNFDITYYYLYAAGYHGFILQMFSGTANPGGPISGGYYSELQSGAGINKYEIEQQFHIYPNPVQDKLSIINSGDIELNGMEYRILTGLGEVIETGIITNEPFNLNMSDYNSGLYVLSIQGENFTMAKKFIKNN